MKASAKKVSGRSLANGLGLFSIGLGLAELLAPKTLARSLGMEGQERLLQAYGLRELGGVGNSGRDGTGSLDQGADCRRSAGLGTLAVQLKPGSPHRGRLALALGMV